MDKNRCFRGIYANCQRSWRIFGAWLKGRFTVTCRPSGIRSCVRPRLEELEPIITPSAMRIVPLHFHFPAANTADAGAANSSITGVSEQTISSSSESAVIQNPYANGRIGPFLVSNLSESGNDFENSNAPVAVRAFKPLFFSAQSTDLSNTATRNTMQTDDSGGSGGSNGWELVADVGIETGTVLLATFDPPGDFSGGSGGDWDDGAGTYTGGGHVFQAVIDWGDGSDPDIGYIAFNNDTNQFEVSGNHTFANAGAYTITISFNEDGSAQNSATASAVVIPPDGISGGIAGDLGPVIELQSFTQKVGTIGDGSGIGDPGDYSATIDWGDGETSDGTISSDGSITGTHSYSHVGYYNVSVAIFQYGEQIGTQNQNVLAWTGGQIQQSQGPNVFYSDADFSNYVQNNSGSAVNVQILDQPQHGTLSTTDGIENYTPDSGFEGLDCFSYCYTSGSETSEPITEAQAVGTPTQAAQVTIIATQVAQALAQYQGIRTGANAWAATRPAEANTPAGQVGSMSLTITHWSPVLGFIPVWSSATVTINFRFQGSVLQATVPVANGTGFFWAPVD